MKTQTTLDITAQSRSLSSSVEEETSQRIDVVMILPPWPIPGGRGDLQNGLPPLGILSIAAYLESCGYVVRVHDIHAEKYTDKQLEVLIRRDNPRFVGINVLTSSCIPAHKIARICKKVVPDTVIVAGGVHAETMPERMLRNSAFDLVVRGDGEEPMREIVQGKPCSDILGLSYRQEGKVVHNPPQPVNMDLDKYPFPAYHLVNFKSYFPSVGSYRNLPAINMLMTRGCPGYCTFCNSARTTLRARDPAQIVAQIEHLKKVYGIRQIMFYDDTFTVLKKECLEFCRLMVEKDLDISWSAYIRGDCFSDELGAAMKKAGCHQVIAGIETGNKQVAKRMGKEIRVERYMEMSRIARRHGLELRGSFIIGSLEESWETMEDTLRFAMELDVDLMQLSISTPYPGSALYQELQENGWLRSTNWYDYGQGNMVFEQPQITTEQLHRFEKYAFKKFYLRPIAFWRILKRTANIHHIKDYFFAAGLFLLGLKSVRKKVDWECWLNLVEEDFFDIDLEEPKTTPLTFKLRQG
jgi:anaerobic magnesium-protoporphyrin IX monomethyl ester cyclase